MGINDIRFVRAGGTGAVMQGRVSAEEFLSVHIVQGCGHRGAIVLTGFLNRLINIDPPAVVYFDPDLAAPSEYPDLVDE
jgi:hypothetical protein